MVKGYFVQLNDPAHHARIALKMALPIGIAEHDVGSAVGTVLIGAMEEAAQIRLNSQHVEVVSAGLTEPGRCRSFAVSRPT